MFNPNELLMKKYRNLIEYDISFGFPDVLNIVNFVNTKALVELEFSKSFIRLHLNDKSGMLFYITGTDAYDFKYMRKLNRYSLDYMKKRIWSVFRWIKR